MGCAHYTKVALYERQSVRPWWAAGLTQNTGPTSTGQFTDDCEPWEPNWADGPLYRPRDNLTMLGGGLEKLMRMSTRHMWWSNRQQ